MKRTFLEHFVSALYPKRRVEVLFSPTGCVVDVLVSEVQPFAGSSTPFAVKMDMTELQAEPDKVLRALCDRLRAAEDKAGWRAEDARA